MVALQSPSASVPQVQELVTIERSDQFGGWLVIWAGSQHGGVHFRWLDAAQHAQELREDPDWEAWLALNSYGAEVQ